MTFVKNLRDGLRVDFVGFAGFDAGVERPNARFVFDPSGDVSTLPINIFASWSIRDELP